MTTHSLWNVNQIRKCSTLIYSWSIITIPIGLPIDPTLSLTHFIMNKSIFLEFVYPLLGWLHWSQPKSGWTHSRKMIIEQFSVKYFNICQYLWRYFQKCQALIKEYPLWNWLSNWVVSDIFDNNFKCSRNTEKYLTVSCSKGDIAINVLEFVHQTLGWFQWSYPMIWWTHSREIDLVWHGFPVRNRLTCSEKICFKIKL